MHFVANILAVMKDYNALKVIQHFLGSFKDQNTLAAVCTTAFQFASKAYLTTVSIQQVCSPRRRLHRATRILWSAVRKLEFHVDSANPVLPTQYIVEKVRGLNPTRIKINSALSHGRGLKVQLLVDRVRAQMNTPPPDDLLAAQVYAKCKEVSKAAAGAALERAGYHEELAMYYLLTNDNKLAEEMRAVINVISALPLASKVKVGIARAALSKHRMDVQLSIDYLLELTKNKPVLRSDSLFGLPAALKTSAGCEPGLLHFDALPTIKFPFRLGLSGGCYISSQSLLHIAKGFRYLRTLRFQTESILTVEMMRTVVKNLPIIEEIGIRSPSAHGLLPLKNLERLHTLALFDTVTRSDLECPYVPL